MYASFLIHHPEHVSSSFGQNWIPQTTDCKRQGLSALYSKKYSLLAESRVTYFKKKQQQFTANLNKEYILFGNRANTSSTRVKTLGLKI